MNNIQLITTQREKIPFSNGHISFGELNKRKIVLQTPSHVSELAILQSRNKLVKDHLTQADFLNTPQVCPIDLLVKMSGLHRCRCTGLVSEWDWRWYNTQDTGPSKGLWMPILLSILYITCSGWDAQPPLPLYIMLLSHKTPLDLGQELPESQGKIDLLLLEVYW